MFALMNRRTMGMILLAALLHLGATIAAFMNSLYFTFPGEPGFNAAEAAQAEAAGRILEVLGFPLLNLALHMPLGSLTGGVLGWLWFVFNSLFWGTTIGGVVWFLARRRGADPS